MENSNKSIDPEQYRVAADQFEKVEETTEYEFARRKLPKDESPNSSKTQGPVKLCLDGADKKWKERFAYTIGLELSDYTSKTAPIFEVSIKLPGEIETTAYQPPVRDSTPYETYLRSLFINEDEHGVLLGFGPVARCLELSKTQNVLLFLKGIDKLDPKQQSIVYSLLKRGEISHAGGIRGNAENLAVITTTNSDADRYTLNKKVRTLRGTVIPEEGFEFIENLRSTDREGRQ